MKNNTLRKIIFLFIAVFLLSGCSLLSSTQNKKQGGEVLEIEKSPSNIFSLQEKKFCSNGEYFTEATWHKLVGLTRESQYALRDKMKEEGDGVLKEISDLLCLSYLSVPRSIDVKDISALDSLVNLEILELQNHKIADLNPLKNLKKLKKLYLPDNLVLTDLSPLSNLRNLEKLDLRNNKISDVSALSGLTNLRDLSIQSNPVTTIQSLAGLINLEDLNLGSTDIDDISVLLNFKKLKKLSLAACYDFEEEDADVLEQMFWLTSLNLYDTDFSRNGQCEMLKTKLEDTKVNCDSIRSVF
jgi:hypothetical protein